MDPKTEFAETLEAQGVDLELFEPPDLSWQRSAERVVTLAEEMLWTGDGQAVLDNMTAQGLSLKTIREARLGFIPGGERQSRTMEGLTVPCGLTIPWFVGSELWAVRVRHQNGQPSYTAIPGGGSAGLYSVERLVEPGAAVFCETELETLLVQQEIGSLAPVLTLASPYSVLNPHWNSQLLQCEAFLLAYRTSARQRTSRRLTALGSSMYIISIPDEGLVMYHQQGGDLYSWFEAFLKELRGNKDVDHAS